MSSKQLYEPILEKDDTVATMVEDGTPAPNKSSVRAPSVKRSAVTKSVHRGTPGGFDEKHQDPSKTLEPLTSMVSTRHSRVASLISDSMGPEGHADDVKWFLFIPMTNSVKALMIMCFMFTLISTGQVFAAQAAHSQALMIDVISMYVDAISYLGNIFGECSDVASQRTVLQLIFSMISLVLLLYFNTTNFIEVIGTVQAGSACPPDDDGEGVEGSITTAFGGLGLLFDAICLYAYYHYAKLDAEVEFEHMKAEAASMVEGQEKAKIEKPGINMLTALLHVSADLFRSTSTFVLGIVLLTGKLCPTQQAFADAVVGVAIAVTIYLGSVYALYEYIVAASTWFKGLGAPLEVRLPDGTTIEVQPKRVGAGKAADAFV